MLQKIFTAFILALIYFIFAHFDYAIPANLVNTVNAAVITIAPDATAVKNLYGGSVVAETNGQNQTWWYVDPVSQERYLLKNGVSVTRLLKKLGQPIDAKTLAKLPTITDTFSVDYNLVNNYRGKILLDTANHGQAWYVNPLDSRRYAIGNGESGWETFKSLALGIEDNKLKVIPIVNDVKFTPPAEDGFDFDQYWQVWDLLKKDYYQPEKVDDQTMFYGSLSGLADSLKDPYTEYFNPLGRKQFEERLGGGAVEGIGAMVEMINGRVVIISPLNGSPAAKAGLLPGDQILKANDQDLTGLTLDDATTFIKGISGTEVALTIYRPSTLETLIVKVIREKISVPNVVGEKLENNLAYFKINIFSLDLNDEFLKVKDQVIDPFTKGVILDLRNNPGGYTFSALNLADNFLPKNEIILQEKYPDDVITYTTGIDKTVDLPIVVLVNEGTASAAEILTAALQEYEEAEVVGTKTFGKGTGQTIANFSDGSALKYTVFEWLTGKGKSLEGEGITPDYPITNTALNDLQLAKAKELLR